VMTRLHAPRANSNSASPPKMMATEPPKASATPPIGRQAPAPFAPDRRIPGKTIIRITEGG
jgi:hypothetical protein